ncbi:putative candidate secreted effector protein [Blumeria hordei DH14]|uniref:Putative candidate secreted effector protein n=1 Tax=Blumeria graminis f. sp. hordei (strain DH14) TaxID=546991 RepID=N1JAT3_BLUG1|nr:putative candidate secreted effector protein [Blumeria hordei DH14]
MWIKFCISLLLSGLIHQVKCIDPSFSDMYLPGGTNGFLCGTEILSIDTARQTIKIALETFFLERDFQRYPKLFEDTNLFNVKSDILLSWPIKLNGNIYLNGHGGKFRLIINTRGQIIGVVTTDTKQFGSQLSFAKCNPVRSSDPEGNAESRHLDEFWSLAYPIFGFNCGWKFLPLSMVKSGNGHYSNYYFQNAIRDKKMHKYFDKYNGVEFIGDDLQVYPLHLSSSSKPSSNGKFRVVFDAKNLDFKGLTNINDQRMKCVTVWDLSSAPLDTIYSPSSILNMDGMADNYWPQTCFRQKIKEKVMWLFIEFALKNWSEVANHREPYFANVNHNELRLWPIRIPEITDNSLTYAYAIGHNTMEDSYGLYQAEIYIGTLENFRLCLNIPLEYIRELQKTLSQATWQ